MHCGYLAKNQNMKETTYIQNSCIMQFSPKICSVMLKTVEFCNFARKKLALDHSELN